MRAQDEKEKVYNIFSTIGVRPHIPLTPPAPLEPQFARVPDAIPSPPAQTLCLPPMTQSDLPCRAAGQLDTTAFICIIIDVIYRLETGVW